MMGEQTKKQTDFSKGWTQRHIPLPIIASAPLIWGQHFLDIQDSYSYTFLPPEAMSYQTYVDEFLTEHCLVVKKYEHIIKLKSG